MFCHINDLFLDRNKKTEKRDLQWPAFCSHNPYQKWQRLLFKAVVIILFEYFGIFINFSATLLCIIVPKAPKILIFPMHQ